MRSFECNTFENLRLQKHKCLSWFDLQLAQCRFRITLWTCRSKLYESQVTECLLLSINLLGSKTRTSSAPKLNPQRMLSHGDTMESQIQSFPEQVARQEPERRCTGPQPSKGQLTSRKGQTSPGSSAFSLHKISFS